MHLAKAIHGTDSNPGPHSPFPLLPRVPRITPVTSSKVQSFPFLTSGNNLAPFVLMMPSTCLFQLAPSYPCTPSSPFFTFLSVFASLSLSLPFLRLKWIMRSLITKTWPLFPRLKPSTRCSALTSFPMSPITDTHRTRRWRDIAMGRYSFSAISPGT